MPCAASFGAATLRLLSPTRSISKPGIGTAREPAAPESNRRLVSRHAPLIAAFERPDDQSSEQRDKTGFAGNTSAAIRGFPFRVQPCGEKFAHSVFRSNRNASKREMIFKLNLSRPIARLAFVIAVLASCLLLAVILISRFVIGTLADDRLGVTRSMLEYPVEYFPGSARLNARLAAAELSETDGNLTRSRRTVTRSRARAGARALGCSLPAWKCTASRGQA